MAVHSPVERYTETTQSARGYTRTKLTPRSWEWSIWPGSAVDADALLQEAKRQLEEKRKSLLAVALTYEDWLEHTEERKKLMQVWGLLTLLGKIRVNGWGYSSERHWRFIIIVLLLLLLIVFI